MKDIDLLESILQCTFVENTLSVRTDNSTMYCILLPVFPQVQHVCVHAAVSTKRYKLAAYVLIETVTAVLMCLCSWERPVLAANAICIQCSTSRGDADCKVYVLICRSYQVTGVGGGALGIGDRWKLLKSGIFWKATLRQWVYFFSDFSRQHGCLIFKGSDTNCASLDSEDDLPAA